MKEIRIDEGLWRASMSPEGVLEQWYVNTGDWAQMGEKLAEVSVEGARHEIMAPAAGVVVRSLEAGEVVEPGDVIGQVR